MAKLSANKAAAAEAIEVKDFSPIPPGAYPARLVSVKTEDKGQPMTGPSGPYWTWEFRIASGEYSGRRFWTNTSLADNALWKLKQIYTALGYTTDSDTDEMIGEPCTIIVKREIATQGKNEGLPVNSLDRINAPVDGEDYGDDIEAPGAPREMAAAGVQF